MDVDDDACGEVDLEGSLGIALPALMATGGDEARAPLRLLAGAPGECDGVVIGVGRDPAIQGRPGDPDVLEVDREDDAEERPGLERVLLELPQGRLHDRFGELGLPPAAVAATTGLESLEALLAEGSNPAVEGGATRAAIQPQGPSQRSPTDLEDQPGELVAAEIRVEGLLDHIEAPESDLFGARPTSCHRCQDGASRAREPCNSTCRRLGGGTAGRPGGTLGRRAGPAPRSSRRRRRARARGRDHPWALPRPRRGRGGPASLRRGSGRRTPAGAWERIQAARSGGDDAAVGTSRPHVHERRRSTSRAAAGSP